MFLLCLTYTFHIHFIYISYTFHIYVLSIGLPKTRSMPQVAHHFPQKSHKFCGFFTEITHNHAASYDPTPPCTLWWLIHVYSRTSHHDPTPPCTLWWPAHLPTHFMMTCTRVYVYMCIHGYIYTNKFCILARIHTYMCMIQYMFVCVCVFVYECLLHLETWRAFPALPLPLAAPQELPSVRRKRVRGRGEGESCWIYEYVYVYIHTYTHV